MKNNALILFLKLPEMGMVKTRLARSLGKEIAFQLYTCFITDILEMADSVSADKFIAFSAEYSPGKPSEVDYPYPTIPQRGDDLGMRMYNAFQDIFRRGYRKAVLIGSDCPGLPASVISQAFIALESYDLVIGPSSDGGYYCIASRRDTLKEELYQDIPWSTGQVLANTIKNAEKMNFSISLLEQWEDIDELDHLIRFYRRMSKENPFLKTVHFIENNKELFYAHL